MAITSYSCDKCSRIVQTVDGKTYNRNGRDLCYEHFLQEDLDKIRKDYQDKRHQLVTAHFSELSGMRTKMKLLRFQIKEEQPSQFHSCLICVKMLKNDDCNEVKLLNGFMCNRDFYEWNIFFSNGIIRRHQSGQNKESDRAISFHTARIIEFQGKLDSLPPEPAIDLKAR